jgi:hypothetical protein
LSVVCVGAQPQPTVVDELVSQLEYSFIDIPELVAVDDACLPGGAAAAGPRCGSAPPPPLPEGAGIVQRDSEAVDPQYLKHHKLAATAHPALSQP